MNMYDLITVKKRGGALTYDELSYMIGGYVAGEIPDYQVSAMLMAIYFKGMTPEETTNLTKIMAASGDRIDLSTIDGIKIDKHSTGGVGDKTTLIVSPIVAAAMRRRCRGAGSDIRAARWISSSPSPDSAPTSRRKSSSPSCATAA